MTCFAYYRVLRFKKIFELVINYDTCVWRLTLSGDKELMIHQLPQCFPHVSCSFVSQGKQLSYLHRSSFTTVQDKTFSSSRKLDLGRISAATLTGIL